MTCACTSVEVATAQSECGMKRRFGSTDFFVIDANTVRSCFKINKTPYKDAEQVLWQNNTSYLEVRRKGKLDILLTTIPMVSYDENGFGCFEWDEIMSQQPTGFYILDIFINCCYCFSLNLRLMPCRAVVVNSYNENNTNGCVAPCEPIGAPECPEQTLVDECGGETPTYSPSVELDELLKEPPAPEPVEYEDGSCETCGLQPLGNEVIGL